jgi:voltage-gated potassium channel
MNGGRSDMARSSQRYEELNPAQRNRLITKMLTRSILVALLIVVAYYALPLDRPADVGLIILVVGLLALAGILTWQIRMIVGSPFPRIRAAETLIVGIPLLLVVFASVYYLIDKAQVDSFSEAMTKTDAMYFTVTVFSTVGFGDITATSEVARTLVTLQMLFNLAVFGLVAKLIFGAVEMGLQRLSAGQGKPAGEPPLTAEPETP